MVVASVVGISSCVIAGGNPSTWRQSVRRFPVLKLA